MDRLVKNQKIKESGKATRERRKDMLCRVFEMKVFDLFFHTHLFSKFAILIDKMIIQS